MSNNKQSSVEWLSNQTYELFEQYSEGNFDRITLNKLVLKATEQAKEMEKEQQPIKVKAIQDDSYHWYVISNELYDEFLIDEQNEDMIDSGEFDAKWGEYRTGGDLNLIQLYTYRGNK
jgi:hypothetical protein